MAKEALYWKILKRKEKIIQCQLCPHFCVIKEGERGKCRVRKNVGGILYSLVYGRPCSLTLDPIEKKPLYHFLPGEQALSIATVGCNFSCENCQNFEISQSEPEDVPSMAVTPKNVIKKAKESDAKLLSYTFTEPTIFYEYMFDIVKVAYKEKIKNMIVSNGYINSIPLLELCKYLDGANIDLKSMSDDFYRKVCGGSLAPVLDALKILKEKKVWIEITNLLIPGLNDSAPEIKKLVEWIKNNLSEDIPIHFSAFYPIYKLSHLPRTSIEKLKEARKIALDLGMNFVYTGNLPDEEGSNTYCPKCKEAVIKRKGFYITENKLKKGKCPCGEKIPGVWK